MRSIGARVGGPPCWADEVHRTHALTRNTHSHSRAHGRTLSPCPALTCPCPALAPPLQGDCHTQQHFHYMGSSGELRVDQAHRGYSGSTDEAGFAALNPLYMRCAGGGGGTSDRG